MDKIIGFIGAGNMGQAMAGGIVSSGIVKAENIIFSDISEENLKKAYKKYGVRTSNSNVLTASMADFLVLSVKPHLYQTVIEEIKDYLKPETVVITIAAGITLEKLKNMFGKDIKTVRTMPNTPAYVYMMIEAMGDAAVAGGMAREKAYKFAAQAVLGSAKMVLETGIHPGELKDMVCSPGGTTIEAVAALEENGFRSVIIKAMKICEEKSKEMSK